MHIQLLSLFAGCDDGEDGHGRAKQVLQLAQWMQVVGQGGKEILVEFYKDAIELDKGWEKAHFAYGYYLDELYQDAKQRQVRIQDNKQ